MRWKDLFFSFEGRVSRRTYWIGMLLLAAAACVPLPILSYGFDIPGPEWPLYNLPWVLVLAWPSMAVSVKRLHDRNKSGWWAAPTYPLFVAAVLKPEWFDYPQLAYSLWLLWECGCRRGTTGPNRFGADPLAADARGLGAEVAAS
jgi:uncharacterized membrane protein YhaH (DUF805 family)